MSNTVTISPKYQVVIPKAVREKLGLTPGQKVEALAVDGRVELVPVRSPRELRGVARGLDSRVEREGDRV
jgi:AbrB family looped-hinge helix DNA binding protein